MLVRVARFGAIFALAYAKFELNARFLNMASDLHCI